MTYNEIAHQVNHKGGSTLIYKEDILLLQSIYLSYPDIGRHIYKLINVLLL